MSPYLYIPVENKKRELQAKVLFACVAAENGFNTILGVNREIKHYLKVWPHGIIAWKGLARKGGNTYKYFHSLGHRVISWCEEGIVYPSAEFYRRFRVFSEALDEVDMFFAWGQNQADDILSEVSEGKNKIILAGNPRLDLLRSKYRGVFDKEVRDIKNEYKSFILVNSNFAAFTHKLGNEVVIENLKKGGRIVTKEDEAFYRGRAENRQQLFQYFVEMLNELNSSLNNRTIVLRPHPSEDMGIWENAISGLENVKLVRRGSAIPWIIASELLIHNNCTTGLEAYLLGKPVISYRPTAGNDYESRLLIAVSRSAETLDSLKETVMQILNGDQSSEEHQNKDTNQILNHYVGNSENEYSVDVIARELVKIADHEFLPQDNIFSKLKIKRKQLTSRLKSKVSGIHSGNNKNIIKPEFTSSKFSSLSVDEVNNIIDGLSVNSGRFKNITVTKVTGTETCVRFEMEGNI